MSNPELPIIDLEGLRPKVASALRMACERDGFFYVRNHGVSESLQGELESQARTFFARPLEEKMGMAMEHGGRAWRGYFPVGGELTSGVPDSKEGIYFGAELGATDPRVQAGLPLHGPNLFPALDGFREAVLSYMAAMTKLGHRLMAGMAESLDLAPGDVSESLLREPLTLFRIFNYPAERAETPRWGVGEHTDYGLLTILKQSDESGLQVRTAHGWIDAPPLPGTFLCNIGDMLERMTYGRYRSTPHRVKNTSTRDRLSLPFFFDPSFDAEVRPLVPRASVEEPPRWDGRSVFDFRGTYGEYLLEKVSKVFPHLATRQLGGR
ncbi:isopenicillin N synthase family oxygenase [Pendulispora rubella]|uniref:2-oxoglutarate-dependent ethylene/succinate-forming enzyme n=1 Tax=Pendulispora rubella TaxID=2741070 RepID=A0ABZ2L4W4_9BACT